LAPAQDLCAINEIGVEDWAIRVFRINETITSPA